MNSLVPKFDFCRHAILLSAAVFLCGCVKDTPAEINEKLIPKVAADLISRQDSPSIDTLPPEVKAALKMHQGEGMTFRVGAPELKGETGIRFYSDRDHRRFLSIALDLAQSEKSYLFAGFSEADGD